MKKLCKAEPFVPCSKQVMFILIGISVNVINQEYLQLDTIWIMAAVPDGRYRMIDVAWFIIYPYIVCTVTTLTLIWESVVRVDTR